MALAQVSNQLLRSQGNDTATVAVNSPLTGNGSQQLPLGLDENYHGADGESLTFDITDITDGHRVTISGIQGSSSFDVLNGQDGANGVNGVNGADGQSITFDITNITNGHQVTLSGVQGSSSFDVMNGENGVDGVSPTFRFEENEEGVTVYVSGAQGESSFNLYNALSSSAYSAGDNIDITDFVISGKDWSTDISNAATAGSAAATAWVSDQHYLTEHQDVSNLPYVQNSALEYTPSQFISAISGNELYSVSAENAFTAETAHFVDSGWDLTNDGDISGYNGSAFVGQGGSVDPSALSAYIPKSAAQNESNVYYSFIEEPNVRTYDYLNVYNVKNDVVSAFDTTWSNCSLVLYNLDINGVLPIKFTVTSDTSADSMYVTAANGEYQELFPPIVLTPINVEKTIFSAEFKDKVLAYHNGGSIDILQFSRPAGAISMTASITSCNNDVLATQPWVENKFNAFTATADIAEYSAGSNIDITNHVVSSKDWSDTITAASSYAYNEATANDRTYSGILPIVVNNTEDKISANCIELSAGNGIDSDKLIMGIIEVSGGVGNSYLLSYYTPTTGFTSNSGLEIRKYVGNTGTTRKVLSGNSIVGELVPEDYTSRQYLSTNAAGNMVWDDISNISPIVLVATSGDIPASGATDGKLYVVTGT